MKRARDTKKSAEDSPSPIQESKKVPFRPAKLDMDEATLRRIIGEELDKKLVTVNTIVPQVAELTRQVQILQAQVKSLEQEQRKRNIIIYGVPESSAKETLLDRLKQFNDVNVKMGLTGIDCKDAIRLGLSNPSKPRPLLIKLHSMNDKLKILKSRKQLKGTNIYIDDDLSHELRHQHSILRKHLHGIRTSSTATIKGFVRLGILTAFDGSNTIQFRVNPDTGNVEEIARKVI